MAVTVHASGTQTCVISTEHSLTTVTVSGVFQIELDLNALAAGDILLVTVKKIVLASGTQRVAWRHYFYGAQNAYALIVQSMPISNALTDAGSIEITLTQTAGTGRAIPWSVLKHA